MSQEDDDTPLNLPTIRVWEIDENSTHYDKMIAAPSDEEMKLMWIIWSLIMGVVAVFTGVVFVAILLDKKARKNPFNVYLLCLMVPDILMSLLCFITCWLNAATGYFYSEGLCYSQSFYFIFGIGANSWLNALIARQLYNLLEGARHFRRYKPPTRKMVVVDALKVYAFAVFVAAWGIIDQPWWPHKTGLVLGTACIPIDYDTASTIFFYCVFFPALMGIPMGYVMYVLYMIQKHDLMPPTGKRRLLALYFFRLAAVFVFMWLPALVFLFIVSAWVPHWVVWAGGAWSHMQGLVSTALSLMKPDIGQTTRNFVTCGYYDGEEDRPSWFPSYAKRGTQSSLVQGSNADLSQDHEKAPQNGNRVNMTGEVVGIGGHSAESKLGPDSDDEDLDSGIETDVEMQESTENSMSTKELTKEADVF
jgi:hypothetical protein